ncbi:NAD(P)-dependent oxidoreductase [Nocardioides zeae]|uniref:NAD(P)-dependent oxidoreductase n=1 Tax=Nocardioides imazamoxiresistens TaxID=3231893 RepID=A0ABU3PU39_9ACTN|nr:NAD(P)-dependent oxidoreductase [Nocardioides zeae]MDT9592741.1 NAD(P)-dependent oxidoreductase [Nocardioides zeae]
MRVLLTGAAGSIGRVVSPGLRAAGHEVVPLDLVGAPEGGEDPWHTVDCADPDAVAEVFAAQARAGAPVEAVVHLAGHPDEAGLLASVVSHAVTTAALLDAMVAHRVDRIVYASSNHAVGGTPHGAYSPSQPLGVDGPGHPDTFYGVGKVTAEALLRLHADRYGTHAVACRIGSFLEEPSTRRHLATWLSHGDAVRMVAAALAAPAPGYAVLYGISANTRAWWDLAPGRALDFEPQDDAEAYAEHLPVRPEDEVEDARVGGPFATEAFWRPALDRLSAPPGDASTS